MVSDGTIGVILNPASGGGKTISLLPAVTASLERSGRRHDIYVTARAGEAPGVVQEMVDRGATTIVAVGGDGTINEVASGIKAFCSDAALGIVPSGHGSDLVRTLRIPRNVDDAMARVYRGETARFDVGVATFDDGASRIFLNVGGLGFDAVVAEKAVATSLPGSTLPYVVSLLRALRVYKNLEMRIEADGRVYQGPALSVIIANACYFGGGMHIAPMADMQDGKLDAAVIGDISKLDLVATVPRVYRGTHVTHPKFTHFPATTLRVTSARPARVQVDGELAAETPVTFSIDPEGIRVVV